MKRRHSLGSESPHRGWTLGILLLLALVSAASRPAAETRLAVDARLATVPFKMVQGKILLPVRVNGSQIYDFVLDTGSPVMLLAAPELAPAMKLEPGRRLTLSGAGDGRAPEAWRAEDVTIRIEAQTGLVELAGQSMFVLAENPRFGAYLGVPAYGIIGRELFDRYIVELDFERLMMTLYAPQHYTYRGSGEVIDIRMVGGHPHCDGVLVLPNGDRHTLDLVIDSGAGLALTVIPDRATGLMVPAGAQARRLGRGLNGEIRGWVSRTPRLELGELALSEVVTAFAERESGIAPRAQANLGAEILRRFRVIFDYRTRRMILEPSKAIDEPFDIDMSGLLLRAEGTGLDQLIIEQVREGSPASVVGIEAGDRLLTLDGRQVSLEEATDLLRQRDGYVLPLTVYRDGRRLAKQLTLKRDV
ncbi:MAG: PDZ domain-containing protein [Acidobacteriota bacterium]